MNVPTVSMSLFLVFVPLVLFAEPSLSPLEQAPDSPPGELAEIEIDARYEYFEDDGIQIIEDRTRLELPGVLWQERYVDGNRLERSNGPSGAIVLGPLGPIDLNEDLRQEIESYHCMRQLQFLVTCPGVELRESKNADGERTVTAWRGRDLFARLTFHAETGTLSTMEYPSSVLAREAGSGLTVVRYRAYQVVDSLPLPHRVETTEDGTLSSIYSVNEYRLRFHPRP